MKRLNIISIIILLSIIKCNIYAQSLIQFGVKAGANISDININAHNIKSSNLVKYYIGPAIKLQVPNIGLGIDAAILYDSRASNFNNKNSYKIIKQQQLSLPINLRYTFGIKNVVSAFIYGGPQWGINIGDSKFNLWKDHSYTIKKNNFSINIGAGVTLLQHLELNANYNIACGKNGNLKLSKKSISDMINNTEYDSYNNALQIGITYYF